MAVIYHTTNLNKRLYRNMIYNILANLEEFPADFLKYWDIHLWGLEDTNPAFFDHIETTDGTKINIDMPSGVTGKYRIDCFLHDSNERMRTRENSQVVMEELCHARLFGTAYFVKGVHDNKRDGKRFKISFWYWTGIWWSRFYVSVIDIREYI